MLAISTSLLCVCWMTSMHPSEPRQRYSPHLPRAPPLRTTVPRLATDPYPVEATPPTSAAIEWGGELAAEAAAAVAAVQRAMQLCQALACEMAIVDDTSSGKTMDSCDTTAGVSFIKPGDDTPVTAADFAIQGMISGLLRDQFPDDRFMGEEDASDLRADPELCSLALRLCSEFSQGARQDQVDDNLDIPRNLMDEGQRDSGLSSREAFLSAVDRGMRPPSGGPERCWVLDPIDGTKGCGGRGSVTGCW
jgi:hypothetical protein